MRESSDGYSQAEIAAARGIATEPHIDRFITSVGGFRVDARLPNPAFENADYIFDTRQVIIELKILETEFGETESFLAKEQSIWREAAQRFSFGQIIRMEEPVQEFYSRKILELYRSPLSRIAKKANRQIRETKRALDVANHRGILWLVNDGFRNVGAELVFRIMCRIRVQI